MSLSALTMLGMTVILAVLLATLTLASGYGVVLAFGMYAVGGSAFLLALAASAIIQREWQREF